MIYIQSIQMQNDIYHFTLNDDYSMWTYLQEELPLKFIKRVDSHVYTINNTILNVTGDLNMTAFKTKTTELTPPIYIENVKLDGMIIRNEEIKYDTFPIIHNYESEYIETCFSYNLDDTSIIFEFIHNQNRMYSFRIKNIENNDYTIKDIFQKCVFTKI
jgi:hypothetical protein